MMNGTRGCAHCIVLQSRTLTNVPNKDNDMITNDMMHALQSLATCRTPIVLQFTNPHSTPICFLYLLVPYLQKAKLNCASPKPLADLGGGGCEGHAHHPTPPPPPAPKGIQILSISCRFREILAKSYVGAPANPPPPCPPPTTGCCCPFLVEILDPPLKALQI